jgi:hypothetical protein
VKLPTKGELAAEAVRDWCRQDGLPAPVAEFRFHPVRKWRFDLCWVDAKLGCEFMGGSWTGGGHTRGAGYARDCEKISNAAALGYRVVLATYDHVRSGQLRLWLRAALGEGG